MPATRNTRYIDALTLPHVPLVFGSALIGRSAYALVILPLLFAVETSTGSVAASGLAVAVYGITASFLAPFRSQLIDKYDRRLILLLLAITFGTLLACLAIAAFASAGTTSMVILAALTGAVAPPLGPTMRVVWAELAPEPSLLRKALSFDSVAEELLYLLGPAAAGIALSIFHPGFVLLVPAAFVVIGTAIFVSSPALVKIAKTVSAADSTLSLAAPRRRTLLTNRRFIGVLLPALVAGIVSGNLTIAIPATFPGTEGAAVAGIALGLFAAGSAVGGLVFGALKIPGPTRWQAIAMALILVATSTAIGLTDDMLWVNISVAAAGLFFSPVTIVAYFTANDFGGDTRKTEATTWVNTSHNIGGSIGSGLAGIAIQSSGVGTSFIMIAGITTLLLGGASVLVSRQNNSCNS